MDKSLIEQIQDAVDLSLSAQEYSRVYHAFRVALEEAHDTLTLEDINDLIDTAAEVFVENHVCTCDACAIATTEKATLN